MAWTEEPRVEQRGWGGRVELLSVLLVALTAVLTAWSAFEASKWGGVMSIRFDDAGAERTESVRSANLATQQTAIDVGLFTDYALRGRVVVGMGAGAERGTRVPACRTTEIRTGGRYGDRDGWQCRVVDAGGFVAHLVTAIINPQRLGAVHEAIRSAGSIGLTVSEVRGYGRQGGKTGTYRGAEYAIDFVPKVKVEVIVGDGEVDGIVDAIAGAARTGKIGDGKVWALPLDRLLRIRTGETGDLAL